jgi:hypothetical protein
MVEFERYRLSHPGSATTTLATGLLETLLDEAPLESARLIRTPCHENRGKWRGRAWGYSGTPSPASSQHVRCVESHLRDPRAQSTLIRARSHAELTHGRRYRDRPSDRRGDLRVRARTKWPASPLRYLRGLKTQPDDVTTDRLVVATPRYQTQSPKDLRHRGRGFNGTAQPVVRVRRGVSHAL